MTCLPDQPFLTAASWFERGNGHHANAVFPLVGSAAQAADDAEKGGRYRAVLFCDLIFDCQQILCSLIDLVGAKFDLKSAPLSRREVL